MKEYWRLIGITPENATEDQIRQAHFRTFRFYQGRKNQSATPEQRAENERIIEYLRRAQYNADLPLPDNLKHLLPEAAEPSTPIAEPTIEPTAKPTVEPTVESVKPKPSAPMDVEIFANPLISEMARDIFATPTQKDTEETDVPPTAKIVAPEVETLVLPTNDVVNNIVLEPVFKEEPSPQSLITKPLQLPTPPLPSTNVPKSLPASGRQIVLGSVISCPDCEWDIIAQTDSYCSGCGKSITSVAVPKELVIYIGDTGSYTKSFTVRNNGLIPITIGGFEVIDVAATLQPDQEVVLGKNESLSLQLHVAELNTFGKRSGRLRLLYHDKPVEIPIQLKEPPNIWLSFPDVPNVESAPEGFLLRLPIGQERLSCAINTDSDIPLTIDSIQLIGETITSTPITIDRTRSHKFQLSGLRANDLMLTLLFDELGSRQFRLILFRVEVPNLIDQAERFMIGDQAVILNSGVHELKLLIKNEWDAVSSCGRGSAQNITLQGAPAWLSISPTTIEHLAANESVTLRLGIDSDRIATPCFEHVELALEYYDPQLHCSQHRPEAIKLPFEFIAPRQFDGWIAIDFGTSNSCAAMFDGATIRGLTVDLDSANPQESPSCIQFVDESKQLYECGMRAYSKRFSGPRALRATAWAFKPQLSQSPEPQPHTYLDIVQGRPHTKTVDKLIEIYVAALVEAVKLRSGIMPRKAVVTYPVTFGKWQRERLAAACRAAGLEEVITPVSESVALAIHYSYLHREIFLRPAVFAVFDFGGGTTDLAIFQIRLSKQEQEPPQLQLLDVGGVALGGELLTFKLARLTYERLVPVSSRAAFAFPDSLAALLVGTSDVARENYRRVAHFAERVKRSFHVDQELFEREIVQNLQGERGNETFQTHLTREQVETLVREHIQQLIEALMAMVGGLQERGAITERRLDWLILGGNSSRLPLVTELLAAAFFNGEESRVLLDTENMKFGVAKGALLYAVAPEALPFPIDQINRTLPCRVGVLSAGFHFDMLFERGVVADDHGPIARRTLRLSRDQQYLRLYYYFGHEIDPKVIDNPRIREYTIPCAMLSGNEVDASFRLLPDCEGIEVILRTRTDLELTHVAPILGSN
ncbi:MAG: Hsp70 family protein [Acidobacteriota bacterium]